MFLHLAHRRARLENSAGLCNGLAYRFCDSSVSDIFNQKEIRVQGLFLMHGV